MPAPLPVRNTATWQFVLADRQLKNKGFLTPHPESLRYTRRESAYNEIAVEVKNRRDLNMLEHAVYRRVLRAWRNGINRFNGEFVEVRETADAWELVAKDPYFNMDYREVRHNITIPADDAGLIAWELIRLQNTYADSHLRHGTGVFSKHLKERKFVMGDRVSEKIEYLTKLEGSFYFTINAINQPPNGWANFVTHFPKGDRADGVSFEYGKGTLGNCYDYARENIPLINRANVVGKNPLMVVSAQVGDKYIEKFGLWEMSRGQVLTDDIDVLADIAADGVRTAPEYRVTMMASPDAPQLFTDFDVGKSVHFLIKHDNGRKFSGWRRVVEATVVLDPHSGAEELESLDLIDPDEE